VDLYGLPLHEFVAARDAEAKRTKDKSLKALRKPTVAAWLVNQLVRHAPKTIEGLLDLGDLMRKAQKHLDAEQMREFNQQRRQLLESLAREGRALGRKLGQNVSDAVEQEVIATLSAALADQEVAAKVREGNLTESLHFAGFGDLASIVAPRKPEAKRNQLEEELNRLRAARAEYERASRRVEELRKQLAQALEEEERAKAKLAEVEGE